MLVATLGGSLKDEIFFCSGPPLRTAPRGLFAPAQRGPCLSPLFWGSPRKPELRTNSALFWAPLLILRPALKRRGPPRRQGLRSQERSRDADIGDVYGVGLDGEDEDSEDEDLEQAGEVASSSSSDLRNPSLVPSTSSNPAAQLVFRYDVGAAMLKAMERGRLHEWTKVEFKAISRKYGLSVNEGKGELMERVRVHFQRLYQL